MAFGQLSLKGRALKLLAGREHSRQELERKLVPHEAEPGQLKATLDDLQARGFIDEQRVVDSLLHRRAGRLGAGRIKQELQAKGLDAERVALAMASLKATEVERALTTRLIPTASTRNGGKYGDYATEIAHDQVRASARRSRSR